MLTLGIVGFAVIVNGIPTDIRKSHEVSRVGRGLYLVSLIGTFIHFKFPSGDCDRQTNDMLYFVIRTRGRFIVASGYNIRTIVKAGVCV